MSFFEPPEEVQLPRLEQPEQKPWWGPPTNELGATVPLRLVLARTDTAVVAMLDAVAYSTGVSLHLMVKRRGAENDVRDQLDDPFGHVRMRPGAATGLPPEVLRFGVQFADGNKATTLGPPFPFGIEAEPTGPILVFHGASGGDREWDTTLWLWPLPPPGSLGLVVEWPGQGISESRHEIDVQPLLEAARSSEQLWPEDGGGSAAISTSFFGV